MTGEQPGVTLLGVSEIVGEFGRLDERFLSEVAGCVGRIFKRLVFVGLGDLRRGQCRPTGTAHLLHPLLQALGRERGLIGRLQQIKRPRADRHRTGRGDSQDADRHHQLDESKPACEKGTMGRLQTHDFLLNDHNPCQNDLLSRLAQTDVCATEPLAPSMNPSFAPFKRI
jgi:hypothetical protein